MKTATLGPEGTFSHLACRIFNPTDEIVFEESIAQVFTRLKSPDIDFAVVPFKNSTTSFIKDTVCSLIDTPYYIVDETYQTISHHLSGFGNIEDGTQLLVHPISYEQCQKNIAKHCPNCSIIETRSNAESAVILNERRDPNLLAIIPSMSSRIYSLPILVENMEDVDTNQTRFIMIGKQGRVPTEYDKTTILFFHDKEKNFETELNELAKKEQLRLSQIGHLVCTDHPLYVIDIDCHLSNQNLQSYLENLKSFGKLQILGSYPRARRKREK